MEPTIFLYVFQANLTQLNIRIQLGTFPARSKILKLQEFRIGKRKMATKASSCDTLNEYITSLKNVRVPSQ